MNLIFVLIEKTILFAREHIMVIESNSIPLIQESRSNLRANLEKLVEAIAIEKRKLRYDGSYDRLLGLIRAFDDQLLFRLKDEKVNLFSETPLMNEFVEEMRKYLIWYADELKDTSLKHKIYHKLGETNTSISYLQGMTIDVHIGTAPNEVISELLADISILYRKMGGNGINFTAEAALVHENALAE